MKRNIFILIAIVAVGVSCYLLGHRSHFSKSEEKDYYRFIEEKDYYTNLDNTMAFVVDFMFDHGGGRIFRLRVYWKDYGRNRHATYYGSDEFQGSMGWHWMGFVVPHDVFGIIMLSGLEAYPSIEFPEQLMNIMDFPLDKTEMELQIISEREFREWLKQ